MALSSGDVLQQRYRVTSRLDQGGMGAVYRAWDLRLDRAVALKEMLQQPGLAPALLAQLQAQFQQEAKILGRLSHPNLVHVYDFFHETGRSYLVMDFVEGKKLSAHIREQGALREEVVLAWAEQLLDALSYCHSQGVIHRDIKPQNIIIAENGRPILVDFGLGKLWNPGDPRTLTVMRGMGTPEYAPPEQYDVISGHTDHRSDIYALGATLYHALSGVVPPTATQRMADPTALKPLHQLNPQVSPAVAAATATAMEPQPALRHQSARAMAAALLSDIPAAAMASGRPRTRRLTAAPARRRLGVVPTAVGVLSALALLVSGGFVVGRWVAAPSGAPPNEEVTVLGSASTATAVPATATATAPPPTVTATPAPTEPPTATVTPAPSRTATATPTGTSTATPTVTATPRPSATPTSPSAAAPVLQAPSQGSTHQNPIVFQWSGTLSGDQGYVVTALHPGSAAVIESPALTTTSWPAALPAEQAGEWRWRVSVVQQGRAIAQSAESMFWFSPFPGGGGGSSTDPTPAPVSSPTPAPP